MPASLVDVPVLQPAEVLAKFGDDLQMWQAVEVTFLTETTRLLGELHQAVRSQRWDAVLRIAHNLRGAASSLGAERVNWVAEAIERVGKVRQQESAAGLIGQLSFELDMYDRAVQSLMATLMPGVPP